MAINRSEFERTLALAEAALERIKALRIAATPRNFEIWYTYAAGSNASLNETLNERLSSEGRISEHELGQIYYQHLSTAHISEQTDEIGVKIMSEIDRVMTSIDTAIGTASSYGQSLAGAADIPEEHFSDRDKLRVVIKTLVAATKEAQEANQALQNNLVESRNEIQELKQNLDQVREESLTDPLTTLSNRKYFQDSISRLMSDAENKGIPFSVLLTDIDNFKKFNDTYGHLTGDQVLRLVALALKNNLKGQDIAARYGGEEFAVLLPRTGLPAAEIVGNHIRVSVMNKELLRRSTGESLGRVTISLGVATWRAGDSVLSLLERADNCLYAAKSAGRNCVVAENAIKQSGQKVA
jgi:diguanylate cyclase